MQNMINSISITMYSTSWVPEILREILCKLYSFLTSILYTWSQYKIMLKVNCNWEIKNKICGLRLPVRDVLVPMFRSQYRVQDPVVLVSHAHMNHLGICIIIVSSSFTLPYMSVSIRILVTPFQTMSWPKAIKPGPAIAKAQNSSSWFQHRGSDFLSP